jgi:hypothetical protein
MMAEVQTESHRYCFCNRVHPVSSIPWKDVAEPRIPSRPDRWRGRRRRLRWAVRRPRLRGCVDTPVACRGFIGWALRAPHGNHTGLYGPFLPPGAWRSARAMAFGGGVPARLHQVMHGVRTWTSWMTWWVSCAWFHCANPRRSAPLTRRSARSSSAAVRERRPTNWLG